MVIGGPSGSPLRSFGVPREVLGGHWGSLGRSHGVPKTEVVLGERPGTVLGGPWDVFGSIGRSLGQS